MSAFDAHNQDNGLPTVPQNENNMHVKPDEEDKKELRKETKRLWVITGPAGCGKTTVAEHLAKELGLPYIEGDQVGFNSSVVHPGSTSDHLFQFHPQSNIDKMSKGIPLTDADRWDWLIHLREAALKEVNKGPHGVVLTCSALKRKYRDVIRIAAYNDRKVMVHFVYLWAAQETILERVRQRKGHYMKEDMVKSQFATLEEPADDERDCLTIDVRGSPPEVQEAALHAVKKSVADMVDKMHKEDES